MKERIVYACITDFLHEPDFKVYESLEELKKNMKCWRQCGILRLKISEEQVIICSNFTEV